MRSSILGRLGGLLLAASILVVADRAPAAAASSTDSKAIPGNPRAPTPRGSAKGSLPDPVLLDGAAHIAEKPSEVGMIGDFELPGDDNVRGQKVGGPQRTQPAGGGRAGDSQATNIPRGAGGGGPLSKEPPAGQAGMPNPAGAAAAMGGGGAEGGREMAGGGQSSGPANPNASGDPISGSGQPGVQPEGIQVGSLGGADPGRSGGAGLDGGGGRSQPARIGDRAMRIETPATSPAVVGAQSQLPNGHVQHHEKATGTGGKPPTSPQGPGRVEKGRTMPAGL